MKELHLLIINKNTAIYKEAIEENLREKNNYYLLENKIPNFWISNSSTVLNNIFIVKILKNTNFFDKIKSKLNTSFFNVNFTIIYSMDIKFIEWLSLRLGYCEYKKIKKYKDNIVISKNIKDINYITSPQGLILTMDFGLLYNKFNLLDNDK